MFKKPAEDRPSAWALATLVGDQDGFLGSRLQPGTDLAIVATGGINKSAAGGYLSSPSLGCSAFQIKNNSLNKQIDKKDMKHG